MILEMEIIKASSVPYTIILSNDECEVYPYIRDAAGDRTMYSVSPSHGRSYVVDQKESGRYVISKGNGLSYSQMRFIHTGESDNDTLGLLLLQDAERDFRIGKEIEALGIKTNHMECVVELERQILYTTGHTVKPILLQYDVECPWRIYDAAFMRPQQIEEEVSKWTKMNDRGYSQAYQIAANVLIRNLRILHDHGILHNAIHEHNYTWALELVDFELASSPAYPYTSEDDRRHVQDLLPREITQTYNVINYIAGVLNERIDYTMIDSLFAEYGFDLRQYACEMK